MLHGWPPRLRLERVLLRYGLPQPRRDRGQPLHRICEGDHWDDDKLDAVKAELDRQDEELNRIAGFGDDIGGSRDELEVEEVDVSTALEARFWMTVHGPLPKQPDAIAKLREALEGLPGVVVELGLVE